jgi:hypothetical protein
MFSYYVKHKKSSHSHPLSSLFWNRSSLLRELVGDGVDVSVYAPPYALQLFFGLRGFKAAVLLRPTDF